MLRRNGCQSAFEGRAERFQPFWYARLFKERQGGTSGTTGKGISRVGMGMEKSALDALIEKGLEHFIGGEHYCQRQGTTGDSLGQAEQVRAHAGVLVGEQASCSPT